MIVCSVQKPVAKPDDMRGPTLKRIVAALQEFGYNSYLGSGYGGLAAFVPLTGGYWDDRLELCRVPQGKVCCYDIVSTVAGGLEDKAILATPVPKAWAARAPGWRKYRSAVLPSVAICRPFRELAHSFQESHDSGEPWLFNGSELLW
jgi:hypothetical protein